MLRKFSTHDLFELLQPFTKVNYVITLNMYNKTKSVQIDSSERALYNLFYLGAYRVVYPDLEGAIETKVS